MSSTRLQGPVQTGNDLSLLIIYVFINSVSTLSIVLFLTRLITLLSCLGFNGEGIFCASSKRAIHEKSKIIRRCPRLISTQITSTTDLWKRCKSWARKAKILCDTQCQNWVPVMRGTFILITVQDFTVWKLVHLYQFSQTKDELFLEMIMTVVFLLHLTHLREIDKDWTTQQGFVLERGKKLPVEDCEQYYHMVFGQNYNLMHEILIQFKEQTRSGN